MNTQIAPAEASDVLCLRTLVSFWRCVDTADHAGAALLIHPRGAWMRRGQELRTSEQIAVDFGARPSGTILFHLVSNAIFQSRSQTHTDFSIYLAVVRGLAGSAPDHVSPIQGAQSIHVCAGEMWHTTEGWKIGRINAGPAILSLNLSGAAGL